MWGIMALWELGGAEEVILEFNGAVSSGRQVVHRPNFEHVRCDGEWNAQFNMPECDLEFNHSMTHGTE
jgi:hypothetical protein